MAKCAYCQLKKGKRSCPALNSVICAGCCGEHRGRAIPCPVDCPYFAPHEAYQRERLGTSFGQERQTLYRGLEGQAGRKALQLLHLLDVAVYQGFSQRSDALDWEVIAGLEFVRKSLGPLVVPGPPPSGFAETLLKEIKDFCEQAQAADGLGVAVLDQAIRFAKAFSGNELRSNRYRRGLIGFIDQYYPDVAAQLRPVALSHQRIILPPGGAGRSHAR